MMKRISTYLVLSISLAMLPVTNVAAINTSTTSLPNNILTFAHAEEDDCDRETFALCTSHSWKIYYKITIVNGKEQISPYEACRHCGIPR